MTKFKVGDRVTLSGVVAKADPGCGYLSYFVELEGSGNHAIWLSEGPLLIQEGASSKGLKGRIDRRTDTTFRDQAAIAALQGWIGREGQIQLQYMVDDMKMLFDYAEALDAERKRRSGE